MKVLSVKYIFSRRIKDILLEDGPIKDWNGVAIPPIVINSQYVPTDLNRSNITLNDLPNIYTGRINHPNDTINYNIDITNYVKVSNWTYRKEAKIRDKWMKIRVRYSGKNLAVIHSLITLYNISYS